MVRKNISLFSRFLSNINKLHNVIKVGERYRETFLHWVLFLFFFKGKRERKRRDKHSQKKNVFKKMFLIGIVDSLREREREHPLLVFSIM